MGDPRRGEQAPVLALTQGDPAGVGPEVVLRSLSAVGERGAVPLVFLERATVEALRPVLGEETAARLHFFSSTPGRAELAELDADAVPVVDPVSADRTVEPGRSTAADAAGAVAAIDAAVAAVRAGAADAVITAPVSKASIARHHLPSFRGHTEYLAEGAGLERYGRDYLMAFLAPELQVALLSTHLPLADAIEAVQPQAIAEAAACLARHAGGRIAVPGLNPHAGEGGLLGDDEATRIVPGIELARDSGADVHGPESPDSVFARAREGAFDWVLALYHDQGLIAVKTAAFGTSTNWTLGLPYLRTSVDHGTAFDIAGRGIADARPFVACVETTLEILEGRLPRGRVSAVEWGDGVRSSG